MTVNKKGITLIELIIAMAISAIVLSVISTFFFTNYNTLNSVNKDLELQSQGEKAINFMVDNIIEGYGVAEVKKIDGSDVVLNSSSETEITKLSVIKQDSDETEYNSNFEMDSGVLKYMKGTEGAVNREICKSIKSIKITPLPSGESFTDCKGIGIKITMKSDKIEKVFVNEVYMRNKGVN
ncbi:PilW family protein [Clostridium sp.]|jgi:prepilin-type N-terminal cleavage/methylation domain-containing protein|uniref:PilW family protein n=1 Tax=Clostridium sp. TaxID=1506 RepID=UPI003EEDD6CC